MCWSLFVFRNGEKIAEFVNRSPKEAEKSAEKFISELEDKSGITTLLEDTTDDYC